MAANSAFPHLYGDRVEKTELNEGCKIKIITEGRTPPIIYTVVIDDAKPSDLVLDSRGQWIMITQNNLALTGDEKRACTMTTETGGVEQRFLFDAGRLRWEKDPSKVLMALGDLLVCIDEDPDNYHQKFIYNENTNRWLCTGKSNKEPIFHFKSFGELTDQRYVWLISEAARQLEQRGQVAFKLGLINVNEDFQMDRDKQETKIDITYNTDEAKQHSEPTNVWEHKINNTNGTLLEVTIEQSEINTTIDSSEWNWNNKLAVTAETKIKTAIPFLSGGEISLKAENTFEIGKKTTESHTEENKWSWNFPICVAPYTTVECRLVVQKGMIDLPFTALITKGKYQWKEVGTYRGVSYSSLDFEVVEQPKVNTGFAPLKKLRGFFANFVYKPK